MYRIFKKRRKKSYICRGGEMIKKPDSFMDLLELQRILDEEIEKKRDNDFEPRKRSELDILLALDDEFQEWLRELPYEHNFKVWKQKEYNREKELEELTDVLFFFLQYFNKNKKTNILKNHLTFVFFRESKKTIEDDIYDFKFNLWIVEIQFAFENYISLVNKRYFTKQDILDTYWMKWQKNMKRTNQDWVIK